MFNEFDSKDLTAEEIKAMFGPSETGIIHENLINVNKDLAIERYYQKYFDKHSHLVEPKAEIDDLIRYLKDNGMLLGIVTGKAKRSLEISLKALQMEGLFDVVITGDDVDEPKPHPEGVNKALSLLGVQNEEAIFIGDSDADILAGIQANVYTIGVQWLPDYQTAIFSETPSKVMKSMKEFKQFFNDSHTFKCKNEIHR